MSEHALAAALDTLVERFDDERGDWVDVLRRADLEPRARRRPSRARRVVVIAFAVAVLALVVLVSTGFGRNALSSLLDRTHVDFWSSDPASQPVRWQFEDLELRHGSWVPPRFAPQAILSQARTVGTLVIRGRERTVSVVPTRRGGFCYIVERGSLGCLGPNPEGPRITPTGGGISWPGTNKARYSVNGLVYGDEIERLTVELANGESEDLDFVYVSEPIDAGFFAYDTPRQLRPPRLRAIVGRNDAGEVVARLSLRTDPPPSGRTVSPPPEGRPLRAGPSAKPSAPLQRGTANGVSFTVGKNGAVLVDLNRIEPGRRALLDRRPMIYNCIDVVERGGLTHQRGDGVSGRFQPSVGFQLRIPTPIDACEIIGSYGHRWPERLGNHSAIEVPLTESGRRFFEDRAAAYDVRFFLRRTEMRRLRRTSSHLSAEEVRRAFGSSIAALPSRAATPPKGKIGYWADASGLLLRRISSTGRRFEVVVGPKGGIFSENLMPYSRVF